MNLIQPTSRAPTKQSKRKRLLRIGLVVLVLLVIIRLALPYMLLNFINNRLAGINGYYGHVDDLDLSLFRGGYIVKDIYIDKVDTSTQKQLPLFSADNIDISIEWKSLLKGQIVSELECHTALLRFTKNASEPGQLENDSNDFRLMLKTFTPLKVNRFEVFNGKIQYLDPFANPPVDIFLENTHILANNLSNVEDTTLLPANVVATADIYEGSMKFNMRINALAKDPTYDLNAEIKNANLVKLNAFFKAYGDFDINKGMLDVYLEMAAKDNKYIGYIKPVIKDLDVVGPEDRKDSILRKLWEGIVGVAGDIAENPKTDMIVTKVPIAGEFGKQTVGTWYAVLAAVRNAFIQAIYPSLDHQVNIGLVKAVDDKEGNKGGLFKQVFDDPLKKEEKRKEKKEEKEEKKKEKKD